MQNTYTLRTTEMLSHLIFTKTREGPYLAMTLRSTPCRSGKGEEGICLGLDVLLNEQVGMAITW